MFESLSRPELQSLSEKAFEKQFAKREVIFQEGDKSLFIYTIAEGQVKSTKYTADGKEVIMEILGRCDMIGQVVILGTGTYDYSASALTEVLTLVIKREDLLAVLKKNGEMSLKIIEALSIRLKDTQNKLQEFVSEKVEQRIARTLLMLLARSGKEIAFTRQEIASMVGTTIETAIRVTSRFKEAKIIETARGIINVIKKEKLELIAEGAPIKFR